ncbi:MAG: FAD-dependent oxidoreductase [Archaeoglobaceae archaeon]
MTEWKLLEPTKVGIMHLKNRIVMPPMCTRLARPDGSATKELISYYEERAKGGVGLIIVEYSFIDEKESRAAICQLGVHTDHMIPGLSELAETIQAYGAGAVLQIAHGGRQTTPEIMGLQPVAPSAISCKVTGVLPRELTITEIEEIEDSFALAANRAKRAGFDGIELHGSHGYLICSFLSPYTNKRTDKYGGSTENRARFALEIIEKVREKVGEKFTVGIRISGDEFVPGGLSLEETTKIAQLLESAGVDYIHVSAGNFESAPHFVNPMYFPRGYLLHLAEAIKTRVNVPVIAVGSLDVYTAEKALKEGKADLVAFGRALIADPEIPKKIAENRIDDIIPCIRGNEGCLSRFFAGKAIRCEVNPKVGREREFVLKKAEKKKKVVVIGGGPAGMEVARITALRGHEVILLEKEARLGGHLLEASTPEFKSDLRRLLEWLVKQLEKSGVTIRLNTEATPKLIKDLAPEVLIIATGSEFSLNIAGANQEHVATAKDVLLGKKKLGDIVVVVGGGLVGCETALYITKELGKRVILLEMLDQVLYDAEPLTASALLEMLKVSGVEIRTSCCVREIKSHSVVCEDKNGQTYEIQANSVILATGLQARTDLIAKFRDLSAELFLVGDCVRPRRIYNAFEEAWRVALSI